MSAPLSIVYVANIRFPTEKAHGYQIARVTTALATEGASVELVVPTRRTAIALPWHEYYDLPARILLSRIACPDLMTGHSFLDRLAFVLQTVWFGFKALRRAIPRDHVIISRDKFIVYLFARKGYRVFYNAHRVTGSRWVDHLLLRHATGCIVNSEGTRDALMKRLAMPVLVAHNGADTNPFHASDRQTLRHELGLPEHASIALYSGHLYGWKGIDTILAAAEHMREEKNTVFVLIGGTPHDVRRYQDIVHAQALSNILFLGHKEKRQVPAYLAAADVLLLPNSAQSEESRTETSPIKLFEYLASERPIIASDLPSIRNVVSEREVFFVKPDDGAALALALRYVLEKSDEAFTRAAAAYLESHNHTWEAHARKIIKFIRITQQKTTECLEF